MFSALQSGIKPREARRAVLVPSRMCVSGHWADICIHNVSSRGAMAAADAPPVPGTYVEIRRGARSIIGRVVWQDGRHFGIRAQDRIDIERLISEPRLPRKPAAPIASMEVERRARDRVMSDAQTARRLERSQSLSRSMQFGALAIACASAAWIASCQVYSVLSKPLRTIESKLAS